MKLYISLPKRYDLEEVTLIRVPGKKKQKKVKAEWSYGAYT